MTAEVIDIKDFQSVRFFKTEVVCGWCGADTHGRVADRSEQVVCTSCEGVMLEINSGDYENVTTIIFSPEND
jgi:Zn finger protein HypA/HybF involved in hydrogenase expression